MSAAQGRSPRRQARVALGVRCNAKVFLTKFMVLSTMDIIYNGMIMEIVDCNICLMMIETNFMVLSKMDTIYNGMIMEIVDCNICLMVMEIIWT